MTLNLSAFLSPYQANEEARAERPGEPILRLKNDAPAELQCDGKTIDFIVVPVASLIELDADAVGVLWALTKLNREDKPLALVLVSRQLMVLGVIMPDDLVDLGLTLEEGSYDTTNLGPGRTVISPRVTPAIYGCPDYPQHPGFAMYQVGVKVPACPRCGRDRKRIRR